MLAERLKVGDEIRVIAPSRSGSILKGEQIDRILLPIPIHNSMLDTVKYSNKNKAVKLIIL